MPGNTIVKTILPLLCTTLLAVQGTVTWAAAGPIVMYGSLDYVSTELDFDDTNGKVDIEGPQYVLTFTVQL